MTEHEIKALVSQAVKETLEHHAECCPLANVGGHLHGVLKDFGNGDPDAGARVLRERMTWVGDVQQKTSHISKGAWTAAIVLIIGAFGAAFIAGAKAMLWIR